MADKQIVDLNDIVQDTASGDFLVVYDLSGTEDKKISFDDLSTKVLSEFGFTGSAAELNIMDGVTASKDELNLLDGVTSTTAELNILDGCKATAAELNLMDAGSDEAVYDAGGQINFMASGAEVINISEALILPAINNNVDLGSNGERFRDLYTAGTTLLGGVLALDGAVQRITSVHTIINATSSKSAIESDAGGFTMSISNGNYSGQLKYLYMDKDGGGAAVLEGANFVGSLAFNNAGEGATLMWDETEQEWYCVGVNGAVWTA